MNVYKHHMMWMLLAVLPAVSHADMSECLKITDQNKKNYCLASYSGSAAFCDKIKSYESRSQCMRMVIAKQREIAYQTPKPPQKEPTK
jgi:hypothetical protein